MNNKKIEIRYNFGFAEEPQYAPIESNVFDSQMGQIKDSNC